MGRSESVVSPFAPGSGRVRDINWPDQNTAGAAANIQLRPRIAGPAFGGQTNNFGGSFAQTGWFFSNGSADCSNLNAGAAGGSGGSISWLNACNLHIRTTKPAFWPLDDDWNVHRVVFVCALAGAVSTDNDHGFELINSNAAAEGILRTPRLGFGIRFAVGGTNGKVNFITRNGGVTTETTLATDGVAGFNIQNFHSYELRIFQAMPTTDAFVKILIDSVVALTVSWAGGTLPVPGSESGNANVSFFPTAIANSSNTSGLRIRGISFQAAPNELAIL